MELISHKVLVQCIDKLFWHHSLLYMITVQPIEKLSNSHNLHLLSLLKQIKHPKNTTSNTNRIMFTTTGTQYRIYANHLKYTIVCDL